MDILQRLLIRLHGDARYPELTQDQLYAFTDLLALSMAIDRHIATQERDTITTLVQQFEWPQGKPSEHTINQSVRRAWDILEASEETQQDYCLELGRVLKDDWLRQLTYEACLKIVHADGHLAQPEQALMVLLQRALNITPERAQELEAKLNAPKP